MSRELPTTTYLLLPATLPYRIPWYILYTASAAHQHQFVNASVLFLWGRKLHQPVHESQGEKKRKKKKKKTEHEFPIQ